MIYFVLWILLNHCGSIVSGQQKFGFERKWTEKLDSRWIRGSTALDPVNDVVYWITKLLTQPMLKVMDKTQTIQSVPLYNEALNLQSFQLQLVYDTAKSRLLLFGVRQQSTFSLIYGEVHKTTGEVTIIKTISNSFQFYLIGSIEPAPNSSFVLNVWQVSEQNFNSYFANTDLLPPAELNTIMFLNEAGNVLWTQSLGPNLALALDKVGGILYLTQSDFLYAFDMMTGSVLSQFDLSSGNLDLKELLVQTKQNVRNLILTWAQFNSVTGVADVFLQNVPLSKNYNFSSPLKGIGKFSKVESVVDVSGNIFHIKFMASLGQFRIDQVHDNTSVLASYSGWSAAPMFDSWFEFGQESVWYSFVLKKTTTVEGEVYDIGRHVVMLRRLDTWVPSTSSLYDNQLPTVTKKLESPGNYPSSANFTTSVSIGITTLFVCVLFAAVILFYRYKKKKRMNMMIDEDAHFLKIMAVRTDVSTPSSMTEVTLVAKTENGPGKASICAHFIYFNTI